MRVCPENSLAMAPALPKIETEAARWQYLEGLAPKGGLVDKWTVRGSQMQKPLLEFSGACGQVLFGGDSPCRAGSSLLCLCGCPSFLQECKLVHRCCIFESVHLSTRFSICTKLPCPMNAPNASHNSCHHKRNFVFG